MNSRDAHVALGKQAGAWATPTASMERGGVPGQRPAGGGRDLRRDMAKWPTPTAQDQASPAYSGAKGEKPHLRLTGAARAWAALDSRTSERWPTPRGQDSYERRNQATMERAIREKLDVTLPTLVANWPLKPAPTTPSDGMSGEAGTSAPPPPDSTPSGPNWPAPKARDWKTPGGLGADDRHAPDLNVAASRFSHPGPPTSTPGAPSLRPDPTLPRGSRPQLNPAFVEWLMNWPEGWSAASPLDPTAFESWETASCRWLQHLLFSTSEQP